MKEQREVEENYLAQQHPGLLKNVHFYYNEESPTNNDEKKNFLQYKEKQKYQRILDR